MSSHNLSQVNVSFRPEIRAAITELQTRWREEKGLELSAIDIVKAAVFFYLKAEGISVNSRS